MIEIPVRELSISDIQRQVIAIDASGNAYRGTLEDIWASTWKYGKSPEEMVKTRVKISSQEGSVLELNNLPLDFRIQVDRGED